MGPAGKRDTMALLKNSFGWLVDLDVNKVLRFAIAKILQEEEFEASPHAEDDAPGYAVDAAHLSGADGILGALGGGSEALKVMRALLGRDAETEAEIVGFARRVVDAYRFWGF
jgi:hypothetical protein